MKALAFYFLLVMDLGSPGTEYGPFPDLATCKEQAAIMVSYQGGEEWFAYEVPVTSECYTKEGGQ